MLSERLHIIRLSIPHFLSSTGNWTSFSLSEVNLLSGISSFIPFLKYRTPCPILRISSGIFFPPNKRRTIAAIINNSELPIINGIQVKLISDIIEIVEIIEIIEIVIIIIIVPVIIIIGITIVTRITAITTVTAIARIAVIAIITIVAVITIQNRMRKNALPEFSFCMALNSCKYL